LGNGGTARLNYLIAPGFFGFQPIALFHLGITFHYGDSGKGAWVAFHNMKTFLSLLSLLSLAGLLMTTTGCEVETHEYRGGGYGTREYGHGYYYYHHDHDHDGYWDRGHYYRY